MYEPKNNDLLKNGKMESSEFSRVISNTNQDFHQKCFQLSSVRYLIDQYTLLDYVEIRNFSSLDVTELRAYAYIILFFEWGIANDFFPVYSRYQLARFYWNLLVLRERDFFSYQEEGRAPLDEMIKHFLFILDENSHQFIINAIVSIFIDLPEKVKSLNREQISEILKLHTCLDELSSRLSADQCGGIASSYNCLVLRNSLLEAQKSSYDQYQKLVEEEKSKAAMLLISDAVLKNDFTQERYDIFNIAENYRGEIEGFQDNIESRPKNNSTNEDGQEKVINLKVISDVEKNPQELVTEAIVYPGKKKKSSSNQAQKSNSKFLEKQRKNASEKVSINQEKNTPLLDRDELEEKLSTFIKGICEKVTQEKDKAFRKTIDLYRKIPDETIKVNVAEYLREYILSFIKYNHEAPEICANIYDYYVEVEGCFSKVSKNSGNAKILTSLWELNSRLLVSLGLGFDKTKFPEFAMLWERSMNYVLRLLNCDDRSIDLKKIDDFYFGLVSNSERSNVEFISFFENGNFPKMDLTSILAAIIAHKKFSTFKETHKNQRLIIFCMIQLDIARQEFGMIEKDVNQNKIKNMSGILTFSKNMILDGVLNQRQGFMVLMQAFFRRLADYHEKKCGLKKAFDFFRFSVDIYEVNSRVDLDVVAIVGQIIAFNACLKLNHDQSLINPEKLRRLIELKDKVGRGPLECRYLNFSKFIVDGIISSVKLFSEKEISFFVYSFRSNFYSDLYAMSESIGEEINFFYRPEAIEVLKKLESVVIDNFDVNSDKVLNEKLCCLMEVAKAMASISSALTEEKSKSFCAELSTMVDGIKKNLSNYISNAENNAGTACISSNSVALYGRAVSPIDDLLTEKVFSPS